MGTGQNPPLREMIAGALDWWREAGVDCVFADEPIEWLAVKALQTTQSETLREPAETRRRPKPAPQPQAPAAPQIEARAIPSTLDAFAAWWMAEPLLADGPLSARVAPRGAAGAELMVIVPEPEREDSDVLLRGPQGRLLDAMLRGFGLDAGQVYFASAIPRHLPGADWDAFAGTGLGVVLLKHVALVAPKRLAVFGASILPLIKHAPPQGPADLRIINHEGTNVPMLACRSLAALLEQPRWKAGVWQAWLEMTA